MFSVVGDITENALPAGWTDESIVVLIGDVKLDLRSRPPGQGASLGIFRLIGDVRVRVPPGTRLSIRGATCSEIEAWTSLPGTAPRWS